MPKEMHRDNSDTENHGLREAALQCDAANEQQHQHDQDEREQPIALRIEPDRKVAAELLS